VPFGVAAELTAAVGQHAQELDLVAVEDRKDAVVEQICGCDRRLAIVERDLSEYEIIYLC